MQIVAAHDLPYAASASIGDIDDFKRKIGLALAASRRGSAFLHVHTPCPLAWGCDSSKTVEMARKAIRSKCWVLYEVFDGERIVLSSLHEPISVAEYLRPQRRFGAITPDQLAEAQEMVDHLYAVLAGRAGNSSGSIDDWGVAAS
jgi:Pyruvate:ferredoxin oxidoreductase and related 2-oxoacid:ferredoxin oxidoreductases, beta subunit